jgi:hypothetical protein
MKNIIKLALMMLLFVSCKETPEASKNSETSESSGSATSKSLEGLMREVTGKNANKDAEYARLIEELLAKTPLTNAQFLEAFPKKLGSLSYDEAPYSGTKNVDANTQVMVGKFGNGSVKIEIIDAAGNFATQAILFLKNYDLMHLESDDNTKYLKKERNGILTSGVYVTSVDEAELKFLYDNRFYVKLKGKGMNVDELWDAINLEDLKRFKEFNK